MKNVDLLINFQNKGIALMGHMGSGKTVIGKLIAKKLNYKHSDSDSLIEENEKKTPKKNNSKKLTNIALSIFFQ